MTEAGKILITIGIVLVLAGILISSTDKLPFIGKLPGDFLIKKEGFTFYFPLTTSIIVSIILSLLFKLFNK
ncbi:MAG: DUF2905 domain-containing protein [Patescibacteria group bacterium]|nr:DUF2905 domain-containing protein [Patescibacteria group bacterium]